ncbi:hypothetical protein HC028_04860 [Planosporangium flavigriseum]|uniref:Large ribosomal subunit protein bL12 C-terminal domain-containing protein n=1 Tax=Planosporangium flavigriseum TaxID=373681 RepID=A0A8J3LYP2_9ACTN|nr:ribosomal protein L7/L12 [Planosporangium flavigriseum]NJC63839.1 hypothetical protein [Planosporangium flavigriseum]GIG75936.1 hypothetical protein Pfl04_43400 [Planosporangium flavigriseum]
MDAALILVLLVAVLGFSLSLSALAKEESRRTRRLAVIERRLQLVMDHLGVVDKQPELPEVVRELEAGRKIQAIKAYRDATGAGLKEAKDAVEALARSRGLA